MQEFDIDAARARIRTNFEEIVSKYGQDNDRPGVRQDDGSRWAWVQVRGQPIGTAVGKESDGTFVLVDADTQCEFVMKADRSFPEGLTLPCIQEADALLIDVAKSARIATP